jgi:hypothetical protein
MVSKFNKNKTHYVEGSEDKSTVFSYGIKKESCIKTARDWQ